MENTEKNIWDMVKKCNISYNWNLRSRGTRECGRNITLEK